MRDIAIWIVEAATSLGRTAALVTDRLPEADGSTNLVVAPHEFYVLRSDGETAIRMAAECSTPVCTEQPGTPWFLLSLGFCVGSALVVDINATAVRAIEREGFNAYRLVLGGVPAMDRSVAGVERDVDVLFLGGKTDRRSAALATLAPLLWNRHADLRLFSFSQPITGAEPGVVFGTDKYELLARSKVLVNLHRADDDGYFEWARMVEAMANRCAVITEPSVGHAPLEASEHFVEAQLDDLPARLIELLDDDRQRNALVDRAHEAVMSTLALDSSVKQMLEQIELLGAPSARRSRWRPSRSIVRTHSHPLLAEFCPHVELRRRLYQQLLSETSHRRKLERMRCLLEHGTDDHVERFQTPAFANARPTVSVIVTLYNYAHVVVDALDSIVASSEVDLEVIVIDDHSTDSGRSVVQAFMNENLSVPILLLASDLNRGLSRSRNLAIEATRTDKVMIMDADNLVYPTCLQRLSRALDDDPFASFAYATLEAFGADSGLRSERGWFVPWLCEANYIDAQAMLRRSTWERHGGYDHDMILGWEDWDLWLRLAQAGEHGVHISQMLGRYRTQDSSMISTTNLFAADLRAGLVERYPTLPWPERTDS